MKIFVYLYSRIKPAIFFNYFVNIYQMTKKIKTKDIDPLKTFTKSEYARKIKKNPMFVQRLIEKGELTIVVINGAELIHI